MTKKQRSILTWIFAILIPLALGGLAALLGKNGMREYPSLHLPPLAPPGIVFGIVWPVLYLLMGISSAKIILSEAPGARSACTVYGVQLIWNVLWTPLFFAKQWRLFSFFWLLVLIVLILIMILKFRKISRTAAVFQIPYFLWSCFAAYLNFGVWYLNR